MSDDYDADEMAEERQAAPGPDLRMIQKTWAKRIEDATKEANTYRAEVERAIKWLRLNREGRRQKATGDRLNIAHSNYEILQASTYSRPPKPVVVPRFGGGDRRQELDAVSRVIERVVESNNERARVHETFMHVRDDLLKAGRGVPWLRYEPTFTEQPVPALDPATGQVAIGPDGQPVTQMQQVKTDERVVVEFVGWKDYLEGAAPTWAKVPWIARRVHMTRKKFAERFGSDGASRAGVSFEQQGTMGKPKENDEPTACVWEIWCRDENQVVFIAKDAQQALEVSEPFIRFNDFFPCPEPAMAICEDGTRMPIPPTLMIEDQLVEIDKLTARINALREALRVRGFYAKGATGTTAADEIEHAIKSTDDRQTLMPVLAWAANGNASMRDMIVWLPIDTVVATIQQCTVMRKEAIELVYQVTGISDVMRGASEASETLGAQQIKAQWGSIRVRSRQGEMTRIARDCCRMVAEIVCELFDPQNIADMAVYGFDPAMVDFMRDDRMRSLMLDVETDSTISPDEDADKARATEFVTALGGMMQQALPVAQQAPELVPVIGAMMKFMATKFRAGRELEGEIDKAVQAITQRAMAPPPPPQPDPTEVVKAEAAKVQAEADVIGAQADVQKAQVDLAAASLPAADPMGTA